MSTKETKQRPVAPSGMARIGSVANAPWWNLKEGNLLKGKLLNIYQRPDERSKTGKSKFFQVEISEPTEGMQGRGDKRKAVTVPAGSVVNLNYGPKTKDLENFIPEILRGAEVTIWCYIDGPKFDIGKGQTMWPIDVRGTITTPSQNEDQPDFEGGDESEES